MRILLDYKGDESYTPNKLCIKIGTNFQDLKEYKTIQFVEPNGWQSIPLTYGDGNSPDAEPMKAFCVQVAVLSNHQNGRDTHIRGMEVYGPRHDPLKALGFPVALTSPEFSAFAAIR